MLPHGSHVYLGSAPDKGSALARPLLLTVIRGRGLGVGRIFLTVLTINNIREINLGAVVDRVHVEPLIDLPRVQYRNGDLL